MNVKKTLVEITISIILILGLGGCARETESIKNVPETTHAIEVNQQTDHNSTLKNQEASSDVLKIQEEAIQNMWTDNTKDVYKGAFLNVFDISCPNDIIGGGHYYLNGNLTGIVLGKYLFEELKDDKELLFIGNEDGTIREIELIPENYGVEGAVLMAGTTAGKDELVLYIFKQKNGVNIHKIAITDYDANCSEVVEAGVDMLKYIPLQIIRDKDGNIYFWSTENGKRHFFVMNRNGDLIWEELDTGYNHIEFIGLPSGEVAMLVTTKEFTYQLFLLDVDKREEKLIFDVAEQKNLSSNSNNMLYIGCQDENNIFYVTKDGIFKYMGNEQPQLLYFFRNHGMKPHEINSMEIDEEGNIGILYSTSSTTEFLFLEPTVEKTEIIEVPFVISEANKLEYNEAIVSFNKKYPQYLITEAEYKEESQLLTELIAGKGPVLVDTHIVDFQEYVKLWECLDGKLLEAGQGNVLLDKIMEFCKIGDKQYGVITEWSMLTFVTVQNEVTQWNQKQFMDYLKRHPEVEGIFAEQSPIFFLKLFFFQSMEKCPFWNLETDEAYLDTKEFKWLLEYAGKVAAEVKSEDYLTLMTKIKKGEYLGELAYLNNPESLAYYDKVFGDEVKYIGIPGNSGSEHYINAGAPITVRSSATEEQKRVAILFLEHLISYEVQKAASETTGTLSVRKDVLEEYLQNIPEETLWFSNGEAIEVTLDTEKNVEEFMDLYEKAEPKPSLPAEVENILEEELQSYFAGQKTLDQVCSVLQNRMQLYLYEH